MSIPAEDFRAYMATFGLVYDGPIPDGRWTRFKAAGDSRDNSWFVYHGDGRPAGAFGCHKRDLNERWKAETAEGWRDIPKAERDAVRRRAEEREKQIEQQQRQNRARCRAESSERWRNAKPAVPAHPYLRRKHIPPSGARQEGELLLVAMWGPDGELRSVQEIPPDGADKHFPYGTEKAGSYFPIGEAPRGVMLVCEGFATGATLYEATGLPVAVAFDCGNLPLVAQAMRTKHGGEIEILICGDNDRKTEGNPGMAAARKAAEAAGGEVVVPEFEDDEDGTDFNDLAALRGPSAVRLAVAAVRRSWLLADLLEDPDALKLPPPVVPRLVWPGRTTLFAAREKAGKSTLIAAAVAAVTNGGRFLGGRCQEGHVLIATEEHINDVAVRLADFGAHPGRVTIRKWKTADPIAELRREAELLQPVLIIVDTLTSLTESAAPESGSSAQWAKIMRPLTRIAQDTGAGLWIAHHSAKAEDGGYRDSTEIGAAVEQIVTMKVSGGGATRTIDHKGRFGQAGSFCVRLVDGVFELVAERDEDYLMEPVKTFVGGNPGCSQRAVERGVTGKAKDVRAALAALLAAGEIEDRGAGNAKSFYPAGERVPGPGRAGRAPSTASPASPLWEKGVSRDQDAPAERVPASPPYKGTRGDQTRSESGTNGSPDGYRPVFVEKDEPGLDEGVEL